MGQVIELASYRWLAIGEEAAGIVERMTIARRSEARAKGEALRREVRHIGTDEFKARPERSCRRPGRFMAV